MTMLEPPPEIADSLRRFGLLAPGERVTAHALTGGVSSDIWRIDLPSGAVCVKRALAKLKVAQDWHAPVSRNAYEVAWMQTVALLTPDALKVLGHDPQHGTFAMEFLDQRSTGCGRRICGRAASTSTWRVPWGIGYRASMPYSARSVDTDAISDGRDLSFHPSRPYLDAAARVHTDLAAALLELVRVTATNKCVLVHGDVSPKNILRAEGPISSTRVRLVWRPGVRSRLLPEPSTAQVPVDADGARTVLGGFDRWPPASSRVDWEPRTPWSAAPRAVARAISRAGRRQVAGRVCDDEGDKDSVRRVARSCCGQPATLAAVRTPGRGARSMSNAIERSSGGASGTRAAARRSRRRYAGRRRDRPRHRAGRRVDAAAARRSTCATAAQRFGGLDVTRAVANVNGEIARALTGRDAADQAAIDAR